MRLLVGLVALVAVVVALATVLIRDLDHPFLRRRVQELVHSVAGVDIEYGRTRVNVLSGLRVTDLVVLSPPRFRPLARELVHVGTVEIGWSLRALVHRGSLRRVEISDVAMTVVRDAHGHLSLAELGDSDDTSAKKPQPSTSGGGGAPSSPPAPASKPWSGLADYLKLASRLEYASIERVAVTLLVRDDKGTVERLALTLRELELLTGASSSGWLARAHTGAEGAPVPLRLSREHLGAPAGELEAELWLDATLAATQAKAAVDIRVKRQTLLRSVQVSHLLHVEAQANIDDKAGRLDLALGKVVVADGAVKLDGSIELPDRAPAVLRLARGSVDLQPIMGTVSAEIIPLHAARFQLGFDIGSLLLTAAPRLAPGGHAKVDGDIEALRVALGFQELKLEKTRLALKAEPTAENGTALEVSLPLHGLKFVRALTQESCAALDLSASGHIDQEGKLSGEATLHLLNVEHSARGEGAAAEHLVARARDGQLVVHASELRLEPAATQPTAPLPAAPPHAAAPPHGHGPIPLLQRHLLKKAVHARLTAFGHLGGLALLQRSLRAEADRLDISAQGQLTGSAPYALDVDLPVSGLRLADGRGRPLHSGPAHLVVHASEILPNATDARLVRGDVKFALDLAGAHAEVTAHKHEHSLDFELATQAPSLAAVRPVLIATATASEFELPWENMALSWNSQGKIEQLFTSAPQLSQRSELKLEHPALKSATGSIAAHGLLLIATTRGDGTRHSADLDLQVRGLKIGAEGLDDVHLTLAAQVDTAAPSLRLRLGSDAKSGPQAAVSATLGFDRRSKALAYDVSVHAAKLLPLSPFLAKLHAAHGFDLSELDLTLGGRGTVVGVVEAIGPSLSPRLSAHPLATFGIAGSIEVRAGGLYWSDNDRVVKSSQVGWRGTLSYSGSHEVDTRKLHGELLVDALHVEFGEHELDFNKVSDALEITVLGDPMLGNVAVNQRLSLGELQQDFLSGYPLRDLTLALQAQRNPDGELQVKELKLQNSGGGTELDLTGHMELGVERRSMHLHGTLNQQLDRLWNESAVYKGSGSLALNVDVHSGNLTLFHTQAAVNVSDANITLPRRGITVEGFGGEVPILADVLLDNSGLRLSRTAMANVYSQLRYADQHPLLSGRSFISVAKLDTPLFTVTGLAGNLRIEHSRVSLNQFELGLREGHVSGQCLLDLREAGPTVQLRVRASHIQSSHGERFDGSAALVLGVSDRSVTGRAEILRIGRRHLLDLLDLHDPHHNDASVNRIRSALGLGYPDRVRLDFEHGFATARISLGGLAGLVRIDPLVGIPMGPIVDKLLAPLQDKEEEP